MSEERLIKLELGRLNLHLPKQRVSLREALSSPKPCVVTRNGGTHLFKREELGFLAQLLSEEEHERLQLPILIAIDPKLGRGAARISGDVEVKATSTILGKKAERELLIYRPEVALLRRRLPTTTQYLFVPG